MPGLYLLKRDTNKPRLSIRERFHNAAARIMPRSKKSRTGGGTNASRRALVAGSLASVAIAPVVTLASPGADAELLRLGQQHDEAFKRTHDLNRRVATPSADLPSDDETDEICTALTAIELAIHQIPAETWAGVVVKARIAAGYVTPASPSTPLLDDIVSNLIDDILRIAGAEPKRHTSWS